MHLLGTLACTLVEGGAAVEKGEKAQIGKSFAAEQGCQLVQLNAWHSFVTRVIHALQEECGKRTKSMKSKYN